MLSTRAATRKKVRVASHLRPSPHPVHLLFLANRLLPSPNGQPRRHRSPSSSRASFRTGYRTLPIYHSSARYSNSRLEPKTTGRAPWKRKDSSQPATMNFGGGSGAMPIGMPGGQNMASMTPEQQYEQQIIKYVRRSPPLSFFSLLGYLD